MTETVHSGSYRMSRLSTVSTLEWFLSRFFCFDRCTIESFTLQLRKEFAYGIRTALGVRILIIKLLTLRQCAYSC